jgi:flavodoxin
MDQEGDTMKNMSTSEVQAQSASGTRRILVAYFSWSGNTREIANQIHKIVGGDLFEIVTVNKYPRDYDETVKQARKELETSYRPPLASEVKDIESYDLVFIGYPNWCYTIPAPVASFLLKCDSAQKAIAPFCTHGGDGLGDSVDDIATLCQRSLVLEGLAVRGSEVKNAHSKVSEWLRKIRVVE